MGFLGLGGAGSSGKDAQTGESDSFKGFSFMKAEDEGGVEGGEGTIAAAAITTPSQTAGSTAVGVATTTSSGSNVSGGNGGADGSTAGVQAAAVSAVPAQQSNLTSAIRASNSGEHK